MPKARAQSILPMLMPALAAWVSDWEGGEGEGESGDDGDDEEGVVAIVFDVEALEDDVTTFGDGVATVEDVVVALEVTSPKKELRAERPHVCGSTASFDVRSKVGVLA